MRLNYANTKHCSDDWATFDAMTPLYVNKYELKNTKAPQAFIFEKNRTIL